jgi:hypothetical protein
MRMEDIVTCVDDGSLTSHSAPFQKSREKKNLSPPLQTPLSLCGLLLRDLKGDRVAGLSNTCSLSRAGVHLAAARFRVGGERCADVDEIKNKIMGGQKFKNPDFRKARGEGSKGSKTHCEKHIYFV